LYLHAKFRGITFKDKDVESQENVGVISSEESPLLISLPNGHFPFPKVAVAERFDCITLIKITKKKPHTLPYTLDTDILFLMLLV